MGDIYNQYDTHAPHRYSAFLSTPFIVNATCTCTSLENTLYANAEKKSGNNYELREGHTLI